MPKQTLPINFSQGLNTKVDPWAVPFGQFELLENSIFQKGGLLQKRNGYAKLASLNDSSYITTLSGNLVSISETVSAYSASLESWITKGTLQPCGLDVLPLIRNNLNQTQCDSVIANGMVLTVYTENNSGTTEYLFAIADSTTGQNIVEPTAIPPVSTGTISGSSRAFVVGNYFIIASQVTISGTKFLQYASIPLINPVNLTTNAANISTPQKITSEAYVSVSSNPGWDGVTINSRSNNYLIIAYNSTTGAQGVHVALLTAGQIAINATTTTIHAFNNAAYIGALVSVCVDLTANPNIFYISFWNNSTSNGYTCAVYLSGDIFTVQFTPQKIISDIVIANLASAAQNGSCTVFSEVTNAYSYDSGVASNYVDGVSVSSAGSVGTPYVVIRSVGLGSKACIVDGTIYFLGAFQSPYQPSYFLINGSTSTSALPVVVSKLAYQNGGGYVTLGLPQAQVIGNDINIAYLFKDLVEALSAENNTQQISTGGIYSQTGVNLVTFNPETTDIDSAEIASNLFISGGYLAEFDGYLPVENNFFLFPDSVECTWSTTGGSIHAQPDGSTNTNAYYYQVTYEWCDNATGFIQRSTPSIPVAVTTTGSGTSGSITVNVPYLRLTSKVSSPVKIVIYRWSVANESYYQVTSITLPTINSTTSDSVAYVDTLADASIIGNNLIYTTGGVVPDANGPANNGIMTLFNASLAMVDAENPNTIWLSKTVIPGTTVEMSQDFTIYVSPTQGTIKSLGPITALAPLDDKLIIFFAQGICYINGQPPNILGTTAIGCSLGNYSQPIYVTSIVGCTNQQSIVLTPNGLMFQSDKGIWLLGHDLSTSYIGAPVEAFNSSTVNSAVVVPATNYVLFTLDTGLMLMFDTYYQQWGTFAGIAPASSCIYQNLHTVLDQYGNILQETPGEYLDNGNPVLMGFNTAWINVAGVQGFERFYWFYLLGQYLSPHIIQCGIAYNYNSSLVENAPVDPINYSSAVPSPYGDQPAPFGSPVNLEQWLIHSKYEKCQSFQIQLREVFNPEFGTVAGPGFTLSGLNIVALVKRGSRPIAQNTTTG